VSDQDAVAEEYWGLGLQARKNYRLCNEMEKTACGVSVRRSWKLEVIKCSSHILRKLVQMGAKLLGFPEYPSACLIPEGQFSACNNDLQHQE